MKKVICTMLSIVLMLNCVAPAAANFMDPIVIARNCAESMGNISYMTGIYYWDKPGTEAEEAARKARVRVHIEGAINQFNKVVAEIPVESLEEVAKILEKEHGPEMAEKFRSYYEIKSGKTASYKPMQINEYINQFNRAITNKSITGQYANTFEEVLKQLKNPVAVESLSASAELSKLAETLLKDTKTLTEVVKILYPEISGAAELEALVRVNNAYLEYANAAKEFSTAKNTPKSSFSRLVKIAVDTKYRNQYNNSKTNLEAKKSALQIELKQQGMSEAFVRNIESRTTTYGVRNLLRNMRGSLGNIGVIAGFTFVSIVLSNSAQAANDKAVKVELNNLTAETIKNKSQLISAVKDNPALMPILGNTEKNNILKRQDILTSPQKVEVAFGYSDFVADVLNNKEAWKDIISTMQKHDNLLAKEEIQQKDAVKYNSDYFKKGNYSLDQYKMEVPDYLNFDNKNNSKPFPYK
ncbi:hypothetical protein Dip510_000123 [Elusimicrobium posterum]|uniref:hypothetical protein n=1 Tax=Elusimicrobium posterum TaxID=3116653 RepID=UPI003C75F34F